MLQTTIDPKGCPYAAIAGMDPLADWLLGPGAGDFLGPQREPLIPCLYRFDEAVDLADLERAMLVRRCGRKATKLRPGTVLSAFAPLALFDLLLKDAGAYRGLKDVKKAVALGSPIDGAALPRWGFGDPPPPPPELPDIGPPKGGWPKETVLMAVIDDGIAFAHERFRRQDGSSRVACFWQQGVGPPSPTVPFGKELLQAEIDQLVQRWTRAGGVDEAGLYAEAGLADFARPGHKAAAWRAAHGTHVLDLAAGADRAADQARRPIIGVELPSAAVADTSFRLLAPVIDAALDYIVTRALQLAGDGPPLPLVICLSYALHAGPHDGSHPLEAAFEQYIASYPGSLRIVLPAGNHHLARGHAIVDFDVHGEVVDLPLRLQPDDRTRSFAEVWLPHAEFQAQLASRVKLALIPPHGLGGTAPPPLLGEQHGAALTVTDLAGAVVARACYRFVPAPTGRGVFAIALQPTLRLRPEDASPGVAPAGVWTLRLKRVDATFKGPVDVRLQRDDAPYGYPIRGRQPYLDHPAYARFDRLGRPLVADDSPEQAAAGECPVKRAGSLNAIATSRNVLVAGGFRRSFEGRLGPVAAYSPGEPVTAPAAGVVAAGTRKPDAVLPSDDSKAQVGVLAAGTASGSMVAFTGTSVAAAELARVVANAAATGTAATQAEVKALAQADAGGPLDPARGGWGRIPVPPLNRVPR